MNNALEELGKQCSVLYKPHDMRAMQILISDLKTIPQSAHRDMMIQRASDLVCSDFNDTGDLNCPSKMVLERDCIAGDAGREKGTEQYLFIRNNIIKCKYDTDITQ